MAGPTGQVYSSIYNISHYGLSVLDEDSATDPLIWVDTCLTSCAGYIYFYMFYTTFFSVDGLMNNAKKFGPFNITCRANIFE